MSEHEDEEKGRFAVPGPESHESEESLSLDERGAEGGPVPPPSEPVEPASPTQQSLWDRIMAKLRG